MTQTTVQTRLTILFILAAFLLASCGSSNQDEPVASTEETAATAATPEEVVKTGEEVEEVTEDDLSSEDRSGLMGLAALTDSEADWQDRLDRVSFSRHTHVLDCTAVDPELIIPHFSIETISEFEIKDCTAEGVTNYANLTGEFDQFGEIFIAIGHNNHPMNEEAYIEFAKTDIAALQSTFTSLFDEATSRTEPEPTADLMIYDYDIADNNQTGFLRIATVPNFKTGHGLNIVFVSPAFSDNEKDEIELFNAYTKRMIDSVAFFERSSKIWQSINQLTKTTINVYFECDTEGADVKLVSMFMTVPSWMEAVKCPADLDADIAFQVRSASDKRPGHLYLVNRLDHPVDPDAFNEAMNKRFADLGAELNGDLRDDTPLDIDGQQFLRHDYEVMIDGVPGFTRIVMFPDFETGVGLQLVMHHPAIYVHPEDEFLLFDSWANRAVGSIGLKSIGGAKAVSPSAESLDLFANVKSNLQADHTIIFDGGIFGTKSDEYLFTANAGSTLNTGFRSEAPLSFTLFNLDTEEILLEKAESESVLAENGFYEINFEYTFAEDGVYLIEAINPTDSHKRVAGRFEADDGVLFVIDSTFTAFGRYAPGQRLGYIMIRFGPDSEMIIQAMPDPDSTADITVEMLSFFNETQLLTQNNSGAGEPENIFYVIGEDGEDSPYTVWVEGADGDAGVFMLTVNYDGLGNLETP